MIKDCQLQQVLTCNQDETVQEVAKKLKDAKERHLFVVEEEKPLGIISVIDISEQVVAQGLDPASTLAKEVMNSPLETVDEGQETEFALKIMMEHNSLSAPVTRKGKLIGTISYANAFAKVSSKVGEAQ